MDNIQSQEWYQHLVGECRAIIVERFYNSNIEAISGYGEVGQRIFTDPNYQKYGKGNRAFNQRLFNDIRIGERTGYYCLQFYEKKIHNKNFKDVCTAVQSLYSKNVTWNKVRAELPEQKEEKNILIPTNGEYQVVVIDPPWPYGTEYDPQSRRVASPYPELPIEELSKFKIPAYKDSVIWLWTTHKFLPDSFDLLKSWNFEYKATFVWNKIKMGMGAWLRMQVEFCLLGVRGKPTWELTKQRDIITIDRMEHSRKPDEFYNMVNKLSPNTNKIDIFSREKREGWDQYGNEQQKF